MNDILTAVLADLDLEGAQLETWVAALTPPEWAIVSTPEGWTIAHQIGHLAWTDEASLAAIVDPAAFGQAMEAAAADPTGFVDEAAAQMAALPVPELLQRWRISRARLADALRAVPEGEKIPWFGPAMSAASMATARIMETWAHAHDVGEALGIAVPKTSRAKHVAYLGVRTRGFSYLVRGRDVPSSPVRIELAGPDGDAWTWGPEDAVDRVTGSGYDFALLATRRRHLDDVDVCAEGAAATDWLPIVQAFAGLPGSEPIRLAKRTPAVR